MRTWVIAGVASTGKSSVIGKLAAGGGLGRTGLMKVDCVATSDDLAFRQAGIPARKLVAGRFCPDHALFEDWAAMRAWASESRFDTLMVETAGLCGRCAPYVHGSLAICVLDATSGIHSPGKLGPVLTDADACVVTKGDLVSQAEREVFARNVRARNPRAMLAWANFTP